MITASTAPTRTAINKFGAQTHTVIYATTSMSVHVISQDSASAPGPQFDLLLTSQGSQKIIYAADGSPTVATDITKTAQAVGAFNAFNGASGTAQQRADAMDAYLQAQGIYPT